MPSDPHVEAALGALRVPIERYRSTIAAAVEEVRGYLAAHRARDGGAADDAVQAGLGVFAAGRIDPDKFARILTNSAPLEPAELHEVEDAFEILRDVAAGGDEMFLVNIGPHPSRRLRDEVNTALSRAGRAFGAARLVSDVRRGEFQPDESGLVGPLSFELWNEGERRLTPPLVIQVDAVDLQAADLAEFLDRGVKFILIIRGDCPPAPLVRLITPGTLVIQTADEAGLERLAQADGPAIAALVPKGAAQFVHDPAGGPNPSDRIQLSSVPEDEPRVAIGGHSVRQQVEELEQLIALAGGVPGAAAPAGEGASSSSAPPREADAAGKLAAWLLSQADLSDLG